MGNENHNSASGDRSYMQAMKEMWEEKGYGDFALTSKNLRDQAVRLEKILGSVADSLSTGIGRSERRKVGESVCEEVFAKKCLRRIV